MGDKSFNMMTDSEYLFDLVNLYKSIPSEEMLAHAERINKIRVRYEVLERQLSFHLRGMPFEKKHGHKFNLPDPARKPPINHHSPVPTPHILG